MSITYSSSTGTYGSLNKVRSVCIRSYVMYVIVRTRYYVREYECLVRPSLQKKENKP